MAMVKYLNRFHNYLFCTLSSQTNGIGRFSELEFRIIVGRLLAEHRLAPGAGARGRPVGGGAVEVVHGVPGPGRQAGVERRHGRHRLQLRGQTVRDIGQVLARQQTSSVVTRQTA